ncbi:hypothetical protein QV01_08750 [Gallibacterium genomosp. 3]|uniref:Amidohydrolase-related domain-containing protein n=1 Tax=Gallibacterium genomosp. 3 TaxID=505345 RepID=A0A1A7NNJ7_9PAST|nr:amidohydrolase family protein [Gallibacterium genomosp. 3]OBW91086.1 hypothetical protein QV01_08750 [Gallibacterium genomosp. 3]
MKIDILIKNANIIDPKKKQIYLGEIAISGKKIVKYDSNDDYEVVNEIDAKGYYISPGWIDSHIHIFKDVTEPGLSADVGLIPMGITTVIDGGSCGIATWPIFKKEIVAKSLLNIFYSINVSPAGQITERYPENVDPKYYDIEAFKFIMKSDAEHIRGLKLRYGAEVVEPFGNSVLDKTIELAEQLNCSITLHVTNPPCPMESIASKMRSGDILCHIYQGKGSTILDDHKRVKEALWDAKKRGVFFDSADARINHSYSVILPAIEQGFKPDIISTDLTKFGMYTNMVWGLPVVLSKWLSLGLSLEEVISACTLNPARIHNLPNGIGTIDIGALANLTVFKVEERFFHLTNRMGESFYGNKMLFPQMTIINGEVLYKSMDFSFK